jgi:hypothetical protein
VHNANNSVERDRETEQDNTNQYGPERDGAGRDNRNSREIRRRPRAERDSSETIQISTVQKETAQVDRRAESVQRETAGTAQKKTKACTA